MPMPIASRFGNGGKYSPFQLAKKYSRYYLTASNGKGHGIHSPFVYDFVRNVLNDSRDFPEYAIIERLRRQLVQDRTILPVADMGAGGALQATRQRSITDLARHAAKPKKLGQLLFRIARYYRPETVLELGTSLGLSTAYLAMGAGGASTGASETSHGPATDRPSPHVFTIEGAPAVASVAKKNFHSLGLEGIDLTVGNFDAVLNSTLDRTGPVDLAFIDGNHRLAPTLRYFDLLMDGKPPSAVLIFDDIHWSGEMEAAWESIKQDSRVYLTIDLFFIGLVFFRDTFKVKQDFVIRF
ncbi:MAG TPA: class I SAM-dependent methyltransferase [Puia sp.]|nr:class I SAM-dependent methyltransferase [Puia sp.]